MYLRLLTFLAAFGLLGRAAWIAARPPVATPTSGEVTLELSVWGMPWENDLYTQVYIPEFERQNPGIKVRFQHFDDYVNRVLLTVAGNIAPDVIRMNIDFSTGWIRRGVNLPLDRYIDGPNGVDRADFLPVCWEGVTWEGQTYGLPQDINMLGLFYNKKLLDEAGMAYPDASWTWDNLVRASRTLTRDDNNDGHPEVVGVEMPWNLFPYRAFVYQAGGRYWNEDKTRAVIANPEAVAALLYMKSMMRSFTLTQSTTTRGGLGADKFFEQGRVALFIDGSWRSPSLKKNAPNLDFGVAPLPRGALASNASTSCYWAVNSRSRHPDEAWKLARFLSSQRALAAYWQTLWVAPPARWSVLRSKDFRDVTGIPDRIPGLTGDEWRDKCAWTLEVLENNWTSVEENGPYAEILRLHLGMAVDRVLLENADPMAALKEAEDATNRQIRDIEALGRPS